MTISNKKNSQELRSLDYDGQNSDGSDSLFAAWEEELPTRLPPTLSVRSRRYREIMLMVAKSLVEPSMGHLLSIGAGNGFSESHLSRAGFNVLVTDKSAISVQFCKRKGLDALIFDFPDGLLPVGNKFRIVYCDGVLGHLWSTDDGYKRVWTRFAELTEPRGFLLLSNDLSDDDKSPTIRVTNEPQAQFFRPVRGWFAQDALASGLWDLKLSRILRYRRRREDQTKSSIRRREVLVLVNH